MSRRGVIVGSAATAMAASAPVEAQEKKTTMPPDPVAMNVTIKVN